MQEVTPPPGYRRMAVGETIPSGSIYYNEKNDDVSEWVFPERGWLRLPASYTGSRVNNYLYGWNTLAPDTYVGLHEDFGG